MMGLDDPSYVIISGGTGANAIASAFGSDPAFILPVSDDGGSSSEILRCFGGPSIGDIRSRLTRLIPISDKPMTKAERERNAIYDLMSYRFPDDASEKVVREIWGEIVEGRSSLWRDIGDDKKECIRAFLVHFNAITLKRAHKRFSFRNFSLGNGFLTGARDMFGSLPSAIFLFKSVASVAPGSNVIPVINTNQTVTIAAELENGDTIVGQCAISHPTPPAVVGNEETREGLLVLGGAGAGVPVGRSGSIQRSHFRRDSRTFDTNPTDSSRPLASAETSPRLGDVEEESAGGNIGYRKGGEEVPLDSPVKRVFYINLYGQEIFPSPNPDYLEALASRDILVYSCGSIWTSIAPCLSLRGLGEAVASSRTLKAKVLLLNTKNDRESPEYRASDYINAIISSLEQGLARNSPFAARKEGLKVADIVTHLVVMEGSQVEVDEDVLASMGVKLVLVSRNTHGIPDFEIPLFTPETVSSAMATIMSGIWRNEEYSSGISA